MTRIQVHTPCMRPLDECDCGPDDEPDEPEDDDGDEAA